MRRIYDSGGGSLETIREYLDGHGYDEDFIIYVFMGEAIQFFARLSVKKFLQIPLDLMAWWSSSGVFQADIFRLRNKDYMDAFAAELKERGVEIVTNTSPQLLSRDHNGLSVSLGDDRKTVTADKMVLAIPPNAAVECS